jgi:hypothetical protein
MKRIRSLSPAMRYQDDLDQAERASRISTILCIILAVGVVLTISAKVCFGADPVPPKPTDPRPTYAVGYPKAADMAVCPFVDEYAFATVFSVTGPRGQVGWVRPMFDRQGKAYLEFTLTVHDDSGKPYTQVSCWRTAFVSPPPKPIPVPPTPNR